MTVAQGSGQPAPCNNSATRVGERHTYGLSFWFSTDEERQIIVPDVRTVVGAVYTAIADRGMLRACNIELIEVGYLMIAYLHL